VIEVNLCQDLPDLRIVSENQKSIVLEFLPKINEEQIIGNDNLTYTRFTFLYSQLAFDSAGRANFFRSQVLLLPSLKNSLTILASDYKIKEQMRLIPKPIYQKLDDFGIREIFDGSKSVQHFDEIYPSELVKIAQIGKTSYGYTGTVTFHPIQSIGKGKVKILSRIVVRIDFQESFPSSEIRASNLIYGKIPSNRYENRRFKKISGNNDSPLANGNWYKIDVQENGIYKIDYEYLQKVNISIPDIDAIRIFGNGGYEIPENTSIAHPNTLLEIPRYIVRKKSDGTPSNEDYLVFYGRGTRGWQYRGNQLFQHYIHPYSEKNLYFFTYDQGNGISMDSVSVAPNTSPLFQPSFFQEKIFIEQERHSLIESGQGWVGKLFTGSDLSESYYNSLPGLVSSSQLSYKFKFYRRSTSRDTLTIFENGSIIHGPFVMPQTNPGDAETTPYAQSLTSQVVKTLGPNSTSSIVKIQIGTYNQDAKTWLDWMELYYQRTFTALNNALIFTTPDLNGSVRYQVSDFNSSKILLFDVTDHRNVKRLNQANIDVNYSCTFQINQTNGSLREIAVIGESGFKTPKEPIKVTNSNIRGTNVSVDYIIISPREFLEEANRLKTHKESYDSLKTLVVDIQQLYNEFSGGVPDPLAIRVFLRFTQESWQDPKPKYVLLFGAGHFDFKNISTLQPNWIPPYETKESITPILSYPSDDKYVNLGTPFSQYALAIGRIPARNVKEAAIVVDKIISYETISPVDPWRNRITYVADDGKTSQSDDGTTYTDDSDGLAESYTPKSFEKNKIYIVAYPTINSAAGRRKPEANRAIINAMNQGTILVNFVGHGNERVWTHEAVFTREDNLLQLNNKNKLFFLIAATCSFGHYDDPKEASAAELLVTMEQGGAIANVSAARLVYGDRNISLNQWMFYYLFRTSNSGVSMRLGDAWQLTKSHMLDENSQKFHFFGDPTVEILFPRNVAFIDSVNSKSASDTVRVQSLDRVRVIGSIKTTQGLPMQSFTGRATIQLFDSRKEISIMDGVGLFQFHTSGSLLYQGEISVTSGQYSAIIPVPKDVSFGKSARISIYAYRNEDDGIGYSEKIIFDGVNNTGIVDTIGPRIKIFLNDSSFQSGGVVPSNPLLIVRLEDESGINTSTVGVGHQLSAILRYPEQTFNLSNHYHSDLDKYTSGEVRYQLNDLSDGRYSLNVKAWDIQNNSADIDTYFEVHTANDFSLLHVVNYPNPFSQSTTFTCQRNNTEPIQIEIKIYSIAGRLIQTLQSYNNTDSFIKILWDGRDRDGDQIANGVYFYKLIARDQSGSRTNEIIGKCTMMH